ncbi:MAG: alpha/beta hydrolase [Burkholderiaceae bacterium]
MAKRAEDFVSYKTVLSPELFKIAWAPFYEQGVARTRELRQQFPRHHLDVSYGGSEMQILDLYLPEAVTATTPVLVFLHGGAFREGHPGQYGFIGKPFLEEGIAFISASYRMAPEAFYPDQVEDVALLLGWLNRNLAGYDLDPRRLVLSGHSSGALVVALAAVRDDWQAAAGVRQDFVKSIVIAGANYDHRDDAPTNLVRDPTRKEEGTVLCNLRRVPDRTVIVFARDERNTGDGRRFGLSGRPLAAALTERGSDVSVFELETDHQGTCSALCDKEGPVYAAVLESLRRMGA